MRWLIALLTLISVTTPTADAKWVHATSAHFDMYSAGSDSDTKSTLQRLEASRAFFLAAVHAHDPGTQPVRVIAFKSEDDFSKYKPDDIHRSKAFGLPATGSLPATIAVADLKPETLEQLFREYAQLALDDSHPTLPYWFRAGLAMVYSTMKPSDKGPDIGAVPQTSFRTGRISDVTLLFDVTREALLASRGNAGYDINADRGFFNGIEATSGFRDPGGAAAIALSTVGAKLRSSQDFAGSAWAVVHMTMFQQDYRSKFGEFLRTLAGGMETGKAFIKVYDKSISMVATDLQIDARQTGVIVLTVPFKFDAPPAPAVKPVTKEEKDKVLGELTKQ